LECGLYNKDTTTLTEGSCFLFALKKEEKMECFSKTITRNKSLENRIKLICSYNYSKCEVREGKIINVKKQIYLF
jgi:hypothetical protein